MSKQTDLQIIEAIRLMIQNTPDDSEINYDVSRIIEKPLFSKTKATKKILVNVTISKEV